MKNIKCCKVVVTCFRGGRYIREETTIGGTGFVPHCYAWHAQNFPDKPEIMGLLGMGIVMDKCVDPGVSLDVIYVINDCGTIDYPEGVNFLSHCDNTPAANGTFRVVRRESNLGRAYGAYSDIFEQHREDYDYFIFTEDDVFFTEPNYAAAMVKDFESSPGVGYVAAIGLANGYGKGPLHAHGAVGISSSKVLGDVYDKLGQLPHGDGVDRDSACENEVMFTNEIYNMGYRLIQASECHYSFAYDYMRGIETKFLVTDVPQHFDDK